MNSPQLIVAKPILRPDYISTPEALADYRVWIRANLELVLDYYRQLGEVEPWNGVSVSEFGPMQYDVERSKLLAIQDSLP